jgi:hypothetical protein
MSDDTQGLSDVGKAAPQLPALPEGQTLRVEGTNRGAGALRRAPPATHPAPRGLHATLVIPFQAGGSSRLLPQAA